MKSKINVIFFGLLTMGSLIPRIGSAVQLKNPIRAEDAFAVLGNIIDLFLGLVGIVLVGMIIYGGFMMLSSRGNDTKIKSGKDAIKYAALGFSLAITAYIIFQLVLVILRGR
jgi:hypothetical protein